MLKHIFRLIGVILVLSCVLPGSASADESTSFSTDAEVGASTEGSDVGSSSYQISDVSMMWRQSTGESESFSDGAADDGESDDGGESGSSGSGGSGGGGGGGGGESGGRRGSGPSGSFDDVGDERGGISTPFEDLPGSGTQRRFRWPAPPLQEILQRPSPKLPASHFLLPKEQSSPRIFEGHTAAPTHFFSQVDAPTKARVSIHLRSFTERAEPRETSMAALVALAALAGAVFGVASTIATTGRVPATVSKIRCGCAKKKRRRAGAVFSFLVLMAAVIAPLHEAHAAASVPLYIMYNGQLRNSSGTAITANHIFRFSFWSTSDAMPSDLNGDGTINVSSPHYANWQEQHNVKPGSTGNFAVKLGSGTSLPALTSMTSFELQNLHLQVEVKPVGSPDTAFEILDVNAANPLVDRSPVRSVPFALNADLLDQRDVGTGSGNIAILGPGGVFSPARIPGGTNSGTFVIDADGSETLSTTLQFGTTLNKSLTYDGANSRFIFDDDLRIQGDLTVTGLINGINLATLSGNAPLKVSSGAGLTVTINAGSYRLNGAVTNYSGASNVAMANNTTNYVFFGSGGFAVSTAGFPTDESAVRLAQVVTAGGAVTSVADRRVTSADDRERTIEMNYRPEFADAVYKGDGSSNVGQLSVTHDSTSKRNHYLWTSTKTTLQDYDIYLRVPLSPEFAGFEDNPLKVSYRSLTGDSADNKLGIVVYDTAGAIATLSGAAVNLAGTAWTTTQIEFTGNPTFTAGQDFLVKFTVFARDTGVMHLGDVRVSFRELLQK